MYAGKESTHSVTGLQTATQLSKMRVKVRIVKKYRLSFVDRFQGFGDFDKRRSFRRFLGPALFHQGQYGWVHAGRLVLGKRRSVERSASVSDSFDDYCAVQCTTRKRCNTVVTASSSAVQCNGKSEYPT